MRISRIACKSHVSGSLMDFVDKTTKLWRSTAFEWGKSDCMLSIAEHVQSVTGHDPSNGWRGTYDTEAGARARVKEAGGECVMLDWSRYRRVSGVPLRGDIVLARFTNGRYAGLCTGDSVAFRMPKGVAEIQTRLLRVIQVWRV